MIKSNTLTQVILQATVSHVVYELVKLLPRSKDGLTFDKRYSCVKVYREYPELCIYWGNVAGYAIGQSLIHWNLINSIPLKPCFYITGRFRGFQSLNGEILYFYIEDSQSFILSNKRHSLPGRMHSYDLDEFTSLSHSVLI